MHGPVNPAEERSFAAMSERRLVFMMAALMSLQALGIDAMLPALGMIGDDLGAAGNQRQYVVGAYLLGSGLGALAPGVLADRFGRRPVLLGSILIYAVLSIACAFVTRFDLLIAVRMIQAFLTAGLSVLPAAIIRDRVGGDRMARMMSTIMMVFMVVPVLAPFLGQTVLLFAGWRWIFVMMAGLAAAIGLWTWRGLPESLHAEDRQRIALVPVFRNMREAFARRDVIGYVVGSSLVFGALFGFLNSAQQLVTDTFGMGPYFPFIFGGAAAGMAVSNFFNSRIVERFGARRVSHTALLAFIAVSVLQVLAASSGDEKLWQFLPLMATNMALLGFVGANFGSISMQPFQHIAGSASSAQSFLRMVTSAVLGAIIGQAFDGTARPLAWALLIAGVVSLVLVLYSENGKLFRRLHPRGSAT
ncbi:Bcr/CflA family efflux MFS transporter [Altererythrobacter aerius]|uniref:Bcr/CflA family efflux transporter n=1 Tax=Tsuneonella aeria TaxID=1837929 RepID=A0A6I4TEM0_9SPHN|nr:multidrug effflux MFS transporter [Tsuneonella aeria]MXO74625.1 Bcr/CflA family efflux MFS transporter [Tsuneonella aeria]